MLQNRLFQALVVTDWLLQLILAKFPIQILYDDQRVEKLISLDGYGAILNLGDLPVNELLLFGFLVASIGMFFFQNWARYLYLVLWLFGWCAALLFGARISLPAQSFVGIAIGTIDGMILYLAFISSLRLEFARALKIANGKGGKQI